MGRMDTPTLTRHDYRRARLEAAARGAIYYDGAPCHRCSATRRYVLASTCVACSRRVARQRDAEVREIVRAARARQQGAQPPQEADRG